MKEHEKSWVKVSILAPQEFAEPAAEALSEHITSGVVIESTEIATDDQGGAVSSGDFYVYGFLPVDEHLAERKERIRKALWHLSQIASLPEPTFHHLESQDWTTAWRKNYRPVLIGKKIVIVPAWMESPYAGRIPVFMDLGMAFGSGTHPTTRLCLHILEHLLTDGDALPSVMLDLGCGSGILSIAAAKLGLETILALDIKPEAVRVAGENLARNHVSDQVELAVGSVPEVIAGAYPWRQFPLVVANMIAPLLHKLIDQGLLKVVAPDGDLILAGMLQEQAPELEEKLRERGFRVVDRQNIEDWVLFRVRRR
jgi:ribosomal protein L11 methyltransferase